MAESIPRRRDDEDNDKELRVNGSSVFGDPRRWVGGRGGAAHRGDHVGGGNGGRQRRREVG